MFFSFPSAAGFLPIDGTGFFGVIEAAAVATFSTQQGIDDRRGAAHAGIHGDGVKRAVAAAGAAFHAGIAILNCDVFPVHRQYAVRAYFEAHPAAGAFLIIELQGDDIAEVNESLHVPLL
jgi:hypothetical protein